MGADKKKAILASHEILDLTKVCEGRSVIKIGDIHGCFDEFMELLTKVNYQPGVDVLILAGDLIDRGPKVKQVLEFVMKTPLVFTVLANHEWKLLRYLQGRPITVGNGLQTTLDQCKGWLTPQFKEWLERLPLVIEWKTGHYLLHAGAHPWKPINQQQRDFVLYARAFDPVTGRFGMRGESYWFDFPRLEKIYFGHMPMEKCFVAEHAFALDGGCVHGGVLRALIDGTEVVEVQAHRKYSDEHREDK
jgi:hypothetical protein